MQVQYSSYDSVEELLKAASEIGDQIWREDERLRLDRKSFIGRAFTGRHDLFEKVRQPWRTGMRIFKEMRKQVASMDLPRPEKMRRRRAWHEHEGDHVCPDRLNLGQPYWHGLSPARRGATPTVSIMTEISTRCDIKPRDIQWRGLVAFVLADLLESAGYRVQIDAYNFVHHAYGKGQRANGFFGGTPGDTAGLIKYTIKPYDRPLNISTLLSAVSGWFYRTAFFAALFAQGWKPEDIASGLGLPRPLSDKRLYEIADNERVIHVRDVWNKEAAEAFLKETLEAHAPTTVR